MTSRVFEVPALLRTCKRIYFEARLHFRREIQLERIEVSGINKPEWSVRGQKMAYKDVIQSMITAKVIES